MERKEAVLKAEVLLQIAEALQEGAAGPCDYWFRRLAERLTERAGKFLEVNKNGSDSKDFGS